MDVIFDAGPGGTSLVDPDVEALGRVLIAQHRDRALDELHHLEQGELVQLLDRRLVLERRDHHMPVVVRVGVEDHVAALAAMNDRSGSSSPSSGFEQKMHSPVFGPFNVLEAPGRPEPLFRHGSGRLAGAALFRVITRVTCVRAQLALERVPISLVAPHVARSATERTRSDRRAPVPGDAARRPRSRPAHLRGGRFGRCWCSSARLGSSRWRASPRRRGVLRGVRMPDRRVELMRCDEVG